MSSCSAEDESVYRTRHGILGTRWLSLASASLTAFVLFLIRCFLGVLNVSDENYGTSSKWEVGGILRPVSTLSEFVSQCARHHGTERISGSHRSRSLYQSSQDCSVGSDWHSRDPQAESG